MAGSSHSILSSVHLHTLLFIFLLASPWMEPSTSQTNAMTFEWMPPAEFCDPQHNYQPVPRTAASPAPPPMPRLPDQYSMTVLANFLQKGRSSQTEEYYDAKEGLADVRVTRGGVTTRTIFDLFTGETYDIVANGSCTARGAHASFFGFVKMDKKNKPIMAPVSDAFRVGRQFNLSYVGDTWVRGVKVNHWSSCQEWKMFGAKFQMDYYFTHQSYQSAFGQGQIPVRIVVNGTMKKSKSWSNGGGADEQAAQGTKLDHIYDFTFRPGRVQDRTVFRLPDDVVCTGRREHRPMPTLPDNFEMDLETVMPSMPGTSAIQQSLHYDWDHRLVETVRRTAKPQRWSPQDEADQTPVDPDKLVMHGSSIVDDYATGLRYVTEQTSKQCRVTPLQVAEDSMLHGNALFNIHKAQKSSASLFTYQGQTMFRGMPVDAWGVDAQGVVQKLFFLASNPMQRKMMRQHSVNSNTQTPGQFGTNNWSGRAPERPSNGSSSSGNQWPRQQGNSGSGQSPQWPNRQARSIAGQQWPNPQSNNNYPAAGQSRQWPNSQTNTGGSGQQQPRAQRTRLQTNSAPGRSQPNATRAGPGMPNPLRPKYPVLVGMVFRNRSAITTSDMPAFLRQTFSQEMMEWRKKMEEMKKKMKNVGGSATPQTTGAEMIDTIASMADNQDRMLRHSGQMDTHVYRYQPLHTDDQMFQVAHCFPPGQTSRVSLAVDAPFGESVRQRRAEFLVALRKALADAVRSSYLHVASLYAMPMRRDSKNDESKTNDENKRSHGDMTRVTFTLLGTHGVRGTSGRQQPDIAEMKRRLTSAVREGIAFNVKYGQKTKSFAVDKTRFDFDDFADVPAMSQKDSGRPQADGVREAMTDGDSDSSGGSSDGLSAAATVGIAVVMFAVGGILTAGVLVFFHRRSMRFSNEPAVPYLKSTDA